MVLKLSRFVSRLVIATSCSLIIWHVVLFLRTGLWHAYNLGEVLSYFGIKVPDFGLIGLGAIYAVLGSFPFFIILFVTGISIAYASAIVAPESTVSYFKRILLLPVTLAQLTISGFIYIVTGIVKYTLISIMIATMLTCVWWGGNYLLFSHQFPVSDSCNIREKLFGSVTFNFLYGCADASDHSGSSDQIYYALFMASQEIHDAEHSGHAWLATVALKSSPSGSYLLTDYQVTGYGPPGGASSTPCYPALTWLYLMVIPAVGFASPIEKYWCLRGAVGDEGRPSVHDPSGLPIPRPNTPNDIDAFLGVNPAVVFLVHLDRDQFDRVNHLISSQKIAPKNYQLLLNDCTTFVRKVAATVGLYIPPRILAAYPWDNIYALMQTNIKSGINQ